MTPSEKLAGKVRRRVRALGYRSWQNRQPGVSVAAEPGGLPVDCVVETRGIALDAPVAESWTVHPVEFTPRNGLSFLVQATS